MANEDSAHASDPDRLITVLQGNRNLLTNNIILHDGFYTLLRDYKVIPSAMIEDIQKTEDREEANALLIGHVGRLGPRTFDRFCDVLSASGHLFLAEHVKADAEHADPLCKNDQYDDVFKKFPSTLKVLSPGEQRALSNYIREKVTDGIIKSNWKSRTAGDTKNADDRAKKVTDTINKDKMIKDREAELRSVTELLENERTAHRRTQTDMVELEVRVHDLQVKYNEQLRIMMSSYDASERANMDTEGRLGVFDRQVKGMNVQIQKYYGMEEYAAMADASNVKVSVLQDNVTKIIDTIIQMEKEVNELHLKYAEERRLLFEALGLIDNGQDLRSAYLDSQGKMNSEVKRLTAEVDLLSMAFGMDTVWSLFEAEREKKTGAKKEDPNKPKGILKNNDISDFDYAFVLHMVKDRLHDVHMNIEKLKRKNLEQERKIGKLEGDMDLIRLRGHVDDPSQLDTQSPTPRQEKVSGSRALGKPRGSPRKGGAADSGWDKSTKLPESNLTKERAGRAKRDGSNPGRAEHFNNTDDQRLIEQLDSRLPPISPTGQMTARSGSDQPTSPGRRNRKQYPGLSKERPADRINPLHKGRPVMGFTETQAKAKMKHIEREMSNRSLRENDLKRLDFQGVFADVEKR